MLTHYDPYTGVLTATCSNEELHCIRDAHLPIDTERAKTGRDLLARLQRLKEERENLGDYVEVHVGLENVSTDSPLFVPLRREYFEAFERGEKHEEFRPYGPRWNEKTCRIGRQVVLSLGYGKSRRLFGRVVSFRTDHAPQKMPAWVHCYGDKHPVAACIGVALDSLNYE
jgi:hypothetical protein